MNLEKSLEDDVVTKQGFNDKQIRVNPSREQKCLFCVSELYYLCPSQKVEER